MRRTAGLQRAKLAVTEHEVENVIAGPDRRGRDESRMVDKMYVGDHVHSAVECMCSHCHLRAKQAAVLSDSRTSRAGSDASAMPPQPGAAFGSFEIESLGA